MLVASGESLPNVFSRLAPYARQAKRASEIIGVVRRALGGCPGQRLMTTCTRRREKSAPLNTLGVAPKLRQNH